MRVKSLYEIVKRVVDSPWTMDDYEFLLDFIRDFEIQIPYDYDDFRQFIKSLDDNENFLDFCRCFQRYRPKTNLSIKKHLVDIHCARRQVRRSLYFLCEHLNMCRECVDLIMDKCTHETNCECESNEYGNCCEHRDPQYCDQCYDYVIIEDYEVDSRGHLVPIIGRFTIK